ncbi:MAG TPA: hypothetical protein DCZ72_13805, partial [Armatimonadetes bacterium]|nr:hypothetical protein [Armatimonadota bacterium]
RVIAVVAGSKRDTERDEAATHARTLALAGIRYADEMLTNSVEGADWRPQLPAYLDPADPSFTQQAYDNTFDSLEQLRGWDPLAIYAQTPGAPYYVKYRFGMDPDAPSFDPSIDPGQDFTDPDRTMPVDNSDITAPHDHFLLRVEYAPDPRYPDTRAIKITSIGRPGYNTQVFDSLTAYKPISVANYALYVHDRTRRAASARLGVLGVDIDGNGAVGDSNRGPASGGDWGASGVNDYLPLYIDGPVRANLDLEVFTPVRLATANGPWRDELEVAGGVRLQPQTGQTGGNLELLVSDAGGTPVAWDPAGNVSGLGLRVALGTPRLEAPALDVTEPVTGVGRYDRLTRYAGSPVNLDVGGASVTVDSGELGYGQGIYLDNTSQRDNLDGVRNTWLSPESWGGRRYVPNGAIIDLYDDYTFADGTTAPAIVITRTDGTTWTNLLTGQPSGGPTMAFAWPNKDQTWALPTFDPAGAAVPTVPPQPDNGLILAEGNIRIRGKLPVSDAANDFHLTVVSRGSIYIEGSLLRPTDYGVAVPDEQFNTRIALLARDHVVVNPTVYAPGPLPGLTPGTWDTPRSNPLDAHYRLDAAGTQSVGLEFLSGIDTPTSVLAAIVDGDQNDGLEARTAVLFHNLRAQLGQPLDGSANQPTLLSLDADNDPAVPGMQGVATPTFLADWANLARAVYLPDATTGQGTSEYLPDAYDLAGATFAPEGFRNWLSVQAGLPATLSGGSQSDLLLKNMKVERLTGALDNLGIEAGLTMTISALMFAERGTFYVIPGDWFDPRALSLAEVKDGTTGNGSATNAAERLARLKRFNYELVVNGAVAVNNLAEPADVAQWSDKWAYPAPGTTSVDLYNNYQSIRYHYDWGLRLAVNNRPLLPALPMGTGLAYVGDEK